MNNNSIFIKLLKEHTDIDKKFIDIFFYKFKIGGELDFDIKDSIISKYIGIELITLRKRLANAYSKTKRFIENVDFIKIKKGKYITYMLNYPAFERLSMTGDTEKAEVVRLYFVKLRQFIVENQKLIYQAIENNNDLKLYSNYETIYFFAIDNRHPNIFKIGRTIDIIKRLRNYNIGRIKEVELKYLALVKNPLLIENCMKFELINNQVKTNREIYKINPTKLKKIIDDCFCKHVSKNDTNDLYKEISDLLGLYVYTKDKINIKPYIIIGQNL